MAVAGASARRGGAGGGVEEEVGTVAGAGEEEVGAGREPRRSVWPPVAAGPALPGLLRRSA